MPATTATVFDFDAWYAEHGPATIPFQILGEVWDIPGDVPAAVLLRMQRLERAVLTGHRHEGIEEDIESLSYDGMVRQMVGDDLVEQWLTAGIRHKVFQAVARRVYAIYKGEDPDEAMGIEPPNTED